MAWISDIAVPVLVIAVAYALKFKLPKYRAWRRNKPKILLAEMIFFVLGMQWLPIGCLVYGNQTGFWIIEAIIGATGIGLLQNYRDARKIS